MSRVLENKVAIITGAGRGLGKAFALKFAEEGAKLLLTTKHLERGERTAKEITDKGGEAIVMMADISNQDDAKKMAEKVIQHYGKVDILLNNAAMFAAIDARPWDAWPVELWDQIFAVNVRGTWLSCKAIAPLMTKQSKGKIINITSDIIKLPGAEFVLPYACTKAALYLLTQSLARALGPSGINVNAIAPGLIATEATLTLPGSEEMFKGALASQCLKKRGEREDLVGVALFLASKEADFITGQFIIVDGGAAFV